MKLKEIRRDGFYTDGTNIYYKSKSNFYGTYTIKFSKGKDGMSKAFYDADVEVEKVKVGIFYDGDLKVIDAKTIELNATTFVYFTKQFADKEEAEKYAEENGVEIFDIMAYNEYVSVEFKRNEVKKEIINFNDIKD